MTVTGRVRGEPTLSALLRGPYGRFTVQLQHALANAGFGDIPPAYYSVFWSLDPDGMRLTMLAQRAHVTKQLMNYFVNLLVELGYLERVADPSDGRARLVRFTDRGRAFDRATDAAIARIEAQWASRLGSKRMRKLRSLLARLDAAAQASPE